MCCQCPWAQHWTGSLNCEPLWKRASAKCLQHWWLVKMTFFCCIQCLFVGLTIQMEGQSYQSCACVCVCVFTAYSYVCVYLLCQSCGRVCGLLLSGSSNQPSDKGSHYFCIIRLQVAKQPLFNHRKKNMRGREWLLMIISAQEEQTQGLLFIYIWGRHLTTVRHIPDIFVQFLFSTGSGCGKQWNYACVPVCICQTWTMEGGGLIWLYAWCGFWSSVNFIDESFSSFSTYEKLTTKNKDMIKKKRWKC